MGALAGGIWIGDIDDGEEDIETDQIPTIGETID